MFSIFHNIAILQEIEEIEDKGLSQEDKTDTSFTETDEEKNEEGVREWANVLPDYKVPDLSADEQLAVDNEKRYKHVRIRYYFTNFLVIFLVLYFLQVKNKFCNYIAVKSFGQRKNGVG